MTSALERPPAHAYKLSAGRKTNVSCKRDKDMGKIIWSRTMSSEIYFKFLFVRDPFQRLISAYKDKFVETPDVHYMERYANKIVDNLKDYTDPSSGNELTFKKVI